MTLLQQWVSMGRRLGILLSSRVFQGRISSLKKSASRNLSILLALRQFFAFLSSWPLAASSVLSLLCAQFWVVFFFHLERPSRQQWTQSGKKIHVNFHIKPQCDHQPIFHLHYIFDLLWRQYIRKNCDVSISVLHYFKIFVSYFTYLFLT